jgi:hypothetical protein
MSDLARRPNRLPRQAREQRAYQLTVAGGTAGLVTVVTGVLAVIGVLGWSLPLLAAVVAIVCAVLFRRTVGRS